MTRAILVLLMVVGHLGPALAAPVISVRARTEIHLDPLRRHGDGVMISGHLRERVTGAPVTLGQMIIEVDGARHQVTTGQDGRFSYWLPIEGEDQPLDIEFVGDSQFDGAEVSVARLDMSKRPLMLSVSAPSTHRRADGPLELTIKATDEIDPAAVPYDVYIDHSGHAATGSFVNSWTDSAGTARVVIPPGKLGPPGPVTLRVHSPGTSDFDEARAEATVAILSASTTTFEVESAKVPYNGRLVGRGQLTDDAGAPLRERQVALMVELPTGPVAIDETLTDEQGRFALIADADELGKGAHTVQARYEPVGTFVEGSRSPPVQIEIAPPMPVPFGYSLAAFAAAAGFIVAFVLLRTKPWIGWLDRFRGGAAEEDGPRAAGGEGSAEPHHGLALARPSLVSTLRRPHDRGFSGTIVSAVTGRPIVGAEIILEAGEVRHLVTDSAGRFAVEDLPAGDHRAWAKADGHVTENFTTTIPHRGELRGARIDLLPVREHIFTLYRRVAQPLLPDPGYWGIWSPRQIVDHVRAERPPGALLGLTDYVEETYFSARIPQEEEIPEAIRRIREASEHLSRVDRDRATE